MRLKDKIMDNISVLNYTQSKNDIINAIDLNKEKYSQKKSNNSSVIVNLIADGGEYIYRYLKHCNLSKESDLLVLPSNHHYYYDVEELKNVKTLINLKKLNNINHIDKFLHLLFHTLQPNANLIGCFSNDKTLKQDRFINFKPSRLLSRFFNFIDSRTDHIMDKKEASELLESHGFKVIDMTDMNGLTYFYSQNVRQLN